MSLKISVLFLALLVPRVINGADFKLNKAFSNNMVLIESPAQANIFGFGVEGTKITVQVDRKVVATAEVGSDEQFLLTLPAYDAGGPHDIIVTHDGNSTTLKNVMFGEVWLCSGQSNMEFEMYKIHNATEEIQDALNYPDIRVMEITRMTSPVELDDLRLVKVPWTSPEINNDTFGRQSAICFLHAKIMQNVHGKPVGAISDAWGGTPVEAWMSQSALADCDVFDTWDPNKPDPQNATAIWNGLIHPILKMPITGVLWYQGEWNAYRNSTNYNCTFPSMISDWRRRWASNNGVFKFGFVQLATQSIGDFNFGYQRWRQTANYGYVPNPAMPDVAMATALDLEDRSSPYGPNHPRDKQTVARRLSWAILRQYYGFSDYPLRGPSPIGVVKDNNIVTIQYDQDITVESSDGFHAKCGETRVAAPVVSSTSSSVNIDIADVSGCPRGALEIEYGWDSRPCDYKKCAVYSADEYALTQSAWQYVI